MQPSKNPVDVIRDVLEPIARDHGLDLDEEALKKARDFCEEVVPNSNEQM